MNAAPTRTATDVAQQVAAEFNPGLGKPQEHRTKAHANIAALVVQVLDVVEALKDTTDLSRAYQYIREPGFLATLPVLDRVQTALNVAREAASFEIPTHYASTGGSRQRAAHDLADQIVTALFRAGLLAVTETDIVKAILDRNYRRDTGSLADRIVTLLHEESDGYDTTFSKVRNAIWMTYSGGTTAYNNAVEVFRFLGRGNEIESM